MPVSAYCVLCYMPVVRVFYECIKIMLFSCGCVLNAQSFSVGGRPNKRVRQTREKHRPIVFIIVSTDTIIISVKGFPLKNHPIFEPIRYRPENVIGVDELWWNKGRQ